MKDNQDAIKNTKALTLIKGSFEGKKGWCYILVRSDRYPEFSGNCHNGIEMELDDYGEVILHGEGENPTDAQHKQILARFGSVDGLMEKFTEILLHSSTA